MTRAFIAVPLPESIRANLLELDRSQQGIRWSSPDRWHITVRFFEHADMGQLKQLFFQMEAQETVGRLGPRVSRLGRPRPHGRWFSATVVAVSFRNQALLLTGCRHAL